MNSTTPFIRIKDLSDALKFYKEKLNIKIEVEYFWHEPHPQTGKHAYAHVKFEKVNILFQELGKDDIPTSNIYITFDRKITSEDKIKKYFEALTEKAKKILQIPQWNSTKTFYGALVDKFGVYWEFKAF